MSKRPPLKQDPEDLPTAMWSPVARSLFAEEFSARESTEKGEEPPSPAEDEDNRQDMDGAGDTEPGPPPLEVASQTELSDDDEGDTLQVWPRLKKRVKEKARRARRGSAPAPDATPPAVAVAGEITDRVGATLKVPRKGPRTPLPEEEIQTDPESLRDTLDEPPSEEVLAAARRREASKPKGKVEAEVAVVAPRSQAITPHSPGSARSDPHATMLVEPARVRFRHLANHECRICGRKVTEPKKRRFRGPMSGSHSFQCERCENVFCAAHVVRTSGLWESLLFGARFSCLLCQEG